jgi:lipopolysaccharide export system permease protein
VFLYVTLLSLPALVLIIAPIALFVAVLYALNKLNSDSELIVMNAAGLAPLRVARPLIALTLLVSLVVAYISIVAMPQSFRSLRDLVTKIRADVVTKIVQEGRFVTLEKGITFHYREKAPGDGMLGILIHDRRDPQKVATYLAERGQITDVNGTSYLVLEDGTVHRQEGERTNSAIVSFERYALDLDQFGTDGGQIVYKPRERTTWELINVDPEEPYYRAISGRFRAELHERLATPLYPLATMAIGFAALGAARTTRQGRALALAGAVVALVAFRVAGFGATSLAVRSWVGVPLIYAVPLFTMVAGLIVGLQRSRGRSQILPTWLSSRWASRRGVAMSGSAA